MLYTGNNDANTDDHADADNNNDCVAISRVSQPKKKKKNKKMQCYKVIFSKTEDKLSPVSNMASSGLKTMSGFIILYIHFKVYQKMCPVIFVLDTKTNILYMMACNMPRQMLLPMVVVDVRTTNYNDFI